MDCILSEIEKVKEERFINTSDGTTSRLLSYGVTKDIIERHKRANPWLNRDVLNNYKRKKLQEAKPTSNITVQTSSSVSDLTNQSHPESSTVSETDPNLISSDAPSTNDNGINMSKKGGRPKGSTAENKRSKSRNVQQAVNYAAMEALSLKQASIKNGNMRVNKGAYQLLCEEAERKFSLDEGTVKLSTVVSRLRSGRRIVATGKGNVSPLVAVEAHFLEVILELASMRQPVTAAGAMNILNSMIVSSNLQEELIAWKKKHGIKGDNEGKLGAHYWVNFKKRHPEINSKRAVHFDSKRDDWCTIENFEKMYKGVYAAMVDAKVAIQLEEEVFVKPDGTITEKEEESVGRKTKFLLTRPEYCLYVDEVGCNTSQKSDGNVG